MIGNRVTYRQQLVLRQALSSYRFAVTTLTAAGVEVRDAGELAARGPPSLGAGSPAITRS